MQSESPSVGSDPGPPLPPTEDGVSETEKKEAPESAKNSSGPKIKLLITGISPETTKTDLETYFDACGHSTEATVMPGAVSSKGFITLRDNQSAEQILSTTHTIRGYKVQVRRVLQLYKEGETHSPIPSPRGA
eukprot:CAMPEP_0172196232 /NCGR_PEP_ID=MMETSP1050-20130122/26691_1 /TAXON_ID=233186 /ORGANISM="Cryptomonas curvata, Strain CCAP979/52" /LENGTH=132 /DNA_ID=CAMNT_0012872467 /DNA_START=88 /DNA_END=482 /DNA_ORIENTATION=-